MWLRLPRRNDAPLVIFPVRVDKCDLQPVDQPERVNAALSVVESVIDSLYGWSLKDANRVYKSDAMQPDIAPDSYSRSKCQSNVFTQCKYRRELFHSPIMTINSCQPVERFSYKIVVVGSRFGPPRPPRDISLISLGTVWIFKR